jgi:hypothetical protein
MCGPLYHLLRRLGSWLVARKQVEAGLAAAAIFPEGKAAGAAHFKGVFAGLAVLAVTMNIGPLVLTNSGPPPVCSIC